MKFADMPVKLLESSRLIAGLVCCNGGQLRLSPLYVESGREDALFVTHDPMRGDMVFSNRRPPIPPDALKGWRFIFRGGE